jgi:hypothetical protein
MISMNAPLRKPGPDADTPEIVDRWPPGSWRGATTPVSLDEERVDGSSTPAARPRSQPQLPAAAAASLGSNDAPGRSLNMAAVTSRA